MRAARHRWGLCAALAASLIAHVGLGSLIRRAHPASPPATGPHVEFELADDRDRPRATEPPPEPAPDPPDSARGSATARPSLARTRRARVPARPPVSPIEPATPETAREPGASVPAAAPPAPGTGARRGLDLSPRSAAIAQIDAAPQACAMEAPSCPAVAPGADPDGALELALDRSANGVPHLAPRPPPEVRRKSDGSYTYDGAAISALIDPDGTVHFEDHVGGIGPLGFTFDITTLVEKYLLDKPVYAAEKRWFLEHTAELRRELADRERSEILARAQRRLRGRLLRLLEDEQMTARHKRMTIFRLWDQCASDGTGAEAKALIVQFVRREMPRGSSLGYGDAELAELNRGRASLEPFAPYGDG